MIRTNRFVNRLWNRLKKVESPVPVERNSGNTRTALFRFGAARTLPSKRNQMRRIVVRNPSKHAADPAGTDSVARDGTEGGIGTRTEAGAIRDGRIGSFRSKFPPVVSHVRLLAKEAI